MHAIVQLMNISRGEVLMTYKLRGAAQTGEIHAPPPSLVHVHEAGGVVV